MVSLTLPKSQRRPADDELTTGEPIRRCGDCTLCCTVMGVDDYPSMPKLPGVRCPDVCSRGCRIYLARPKSCREFACIWVQGGLPKEFRPDKIGVVFSTDETGERLLGHIDDRRPTLWLKNKALVDLLTRIGKRGAEVGLGLTGTGKVTHRFTRDGLVLRPDDADKELEL